MISFGYPILLSFFIYSVDKSMVIGAFTSRNNKYHGKFATGLVKGEEIILEYFEPGDVKRPGEISISRIVHAYKNLFTFNSTILGKTAEFGSSESCNNNVYCPEAEDWENEVHSVGRLIVLNGTALCSGSLINNVNENYTPYLLTANHCLGGDVNTWIIWFNYESSTCSNPSSEPSYQTLSGATLKANNAASDFALVMLDETPPLDYNVYYNGWSNINIAPTYTVCIHHPSGDIKKISYDDDSAVSSDYDPEPYLSNSHWEVVWDDGTTEGGSSGSPLIDQNHKVVGQLHGGWASCSNQNSSDYYGKFSMSWNYGSSSSTRLRDWLDPDNTSATVLNGMENGMLSEGTLPANATWSGTHTLTGNVTVPSGVTLTIASGAMVNYNGYTLSSSGGTISIQSGGVITLNPATYVDITGSGNTYEVNGINVGTTFNGIGQSIETKEDFF